MSFDIGGYDYSQFYKDQQNKTEDKKTTPTLNLASFSGVMDDILEETEGAYQEAFVPPISAPELDGSDPNASSTDNTAQPDADTVYESEVEKGMQNATLTPQLKAKGFTTQTLKNSLAFALAHPNSNVDPDVKAMLDQIKQQALTNTQSQVEVPEGWTPPEADTEAMDEKISDAYTNQFASLLADDPDVDTTTANRVFLAFSHPEHESELNDTEKALLNSLKEQVETDAETDCGIPEDYEFTPDSSTFDEAVSGYQDEVFQELLGQQEGLSDSDIAQLTTLYYSPDAEVPDKEQLSSLAQQLKGQAEDQTSSDLGLPKTYVASPSTNTYRTQLYNSYNNKFNALVKQSNLDPAAKQQLLATLGLNPQNLPDELKALFDSLKDETRASLIEDFGLPPDWDPSLEFTESEGTEETDETGESEGAEGAEGAEETEESQDPLDLAPVAKKVLSNSSNASGEIDTSDVTSPTSDFQLRQNGYDYQQETLDGVSEFAKTYAPADGAMTIMDFMEIVSSMLSESRDASYAAQQANVELASASSKSNLESRKAQVEMKMEQLRNPKKDVLEILFTTLFGDEFGGFLADCMKLQLWVADMILGGALSSISDACGIEPLTENPLLQMGIISKSQAKTMDLAVQIIVMVVQMIISIVIAQPELAGALVARISCQIAEACVKVAVEVAVKEVAVQAAKVTLEETTKEVAKVAVKEAVKSAMKESIETTCKQAVEEAVEKGVSREIAEQTANAAKEAALQSVDDVAEQVTVNAFREAGIDVAEKGAKETVMRAKNKIGDAMESLSDRTIGRVKEVVGVTGRTSQKEAATEFRNVAGRVSEGVTDDLTKAGEEISEKAAKEAGGMARRFGKDISQNVMQSQGGWRSGLQSLMQMQEPIQLASDVIGGAAQGVASGRQAALDLKNAKLKSIDEELEGTIQMITKFVNSLLDTLMEIASDISFNLDINSKSWDLQTNFSWKG